MRPPDPTEPAQPTRPPRHPEAPFGPSSVGSRARDQAAGPRGRAGSKKRTSWMAKEVALREDDLRSEVNRAGHRHSRSGQLKRAPPPQPGLHCRTPGWVGATPTRVSSDTDRRSSIFKAGPPSLRAHEGDRAGDRGPNCRPDSGGPLRRQTPTSKPPCC